MTPLGFPGTFPGGLTTGYTTIGAVPQLRTGTLGFPGTFQASLSTGYTNIGAVQKLEAAATGVKRLPMMGCG